MPRSSYKAAISQERRLLVNMKILGCLPVLCVFIVFQTAQVSGRRCFSCRSRSDLGSCKDPFRFNGTSVEKERGVSVVPCASGWCSKMIEGGSSFTDFSEYGIATQRSCLQRGPSDNEERCAQTEWNHKKVFLCFCQGDLCNSSSQTKPFLVTILAAISVFACSLLFSNAQVA